MSLITCQHFENYVQANGEMMFLLDRITSELTGQTGRPILSYRLHSIASHMALSLGFCGWLPTRRSPSKAGQSRSHACAPALGVGCATPSRRINSA